jgi:hypothetical protein
VNFEYNFERSFLLVFIFWFKGSEAHCGSLARERTAFFCLTILQNVWTANLFGSLNLFKRVHIMAISALVDLSLKFLQLTVLLKLFEKLLGMRASLWACSCSDMLPDHVPIFAKQL